MTKIIQFIMIIGALAVPSKVTASFLKESVEDQKDKKEVHVSFYDRMCAKFRDDLDRKFKENLKNITKRYLGNELSGENYDLEMDKVRDIASDMIRESVKKSSKKCDAEFLIERLEAEYELFEERVVGEESQRFNLQQMTIKLRECYDLYKESGRKNGRYYEELETCKVVIDDIFSNSQGKNKDWLLVFAAKYNCIEIAQYLIEKRYVTNIRAQDDSGMTAFDWIKTEDCPALQGTHRTYIVKNGQVVSVVRKSAHSNPEFTEYLIKKWKEQQYAPAMAAAAQAQSMWDAHHAYHLDRAAHHPIKAKSQLNAQIAHDMILLWNNDYASWWKDHQEANKKRDNKCSICKDSQKKDEKEASNKLERRKSL